MSIGLVLTCSSRNHPSPFSSDISSYRRSGISYRTWGTVPACNTEIHANSVNMFVLTLEPPFFNPSLKLPSMATAAALNFTSESRPGVGKFCCNKPCPSPTNLSEDRPGRQKLEHARRGGRMYLPRKRHRNQSSTQVPLGGLKIGILMQAQHLQVDRIFRCRVCSSRDSDRFPSAAQGQSRTRRSLDYFFLEKRLFEYHGVLLAQRTSRGHFSGGI